MGEKWKEVTKTSLKTLDKKKTNEKEQNEKYVDSKMVFWKKIKEIDQINRRVKRLEVIVLKDAETKIASLSDEKAGTVLEDGILTIEEIINNHRKTRWIIINDII